MNTADLGQLLDPLPDAPVVAERTALVDVDVQHFQVYGLAERVREAGLGEVYAYYNGQVSRILPKIRELKEECRRAGIEVIHVRCASYTGDGRDCSPLFRSVDVKASGTEQDAKVVDEVGPEGDEIVVSKVSAGAFSGSDLDGVLRSLGSETLIFTGLVTDGCVEGTLRAAADRGYEVFLVEDACAAWTQEQHEAAIRILGRWFAHVVDSAAMIRRIRAGSNPESGRQKAGASAWVARVHRALRQS